MCKVFVDYYHLAVIIKCISCLYVMNSVLLKNFNFCGAVNIGDVAQLAERPPCTRKASGSNPLISTSLRLYGPSGSASYVWLAPSPKEAATGMQTEIKNRERR